jgi:DNA-binding NarL/FixJ family response regulator
VFDHRPHPVSTALFLHSETHPGEENMSQPFQMRPIVLLVEDDPFMRTAVADFLREEMGMGVQMAVSYNEARGQLQRHASAYELALVDISLPREDDSETERQPLGVKLVRELKERNPDCGVVLWSAYTHFLHEIMALISEGYQGLAYVPKGSRMQVLKTAIERVMKGDVFLHRAVLGDPQVDIEKTILSAFDPPTAQLVADVADRLDELSPRQMEVVERMTKTPAAIARDLNLEVRTVRNYQDAIYERLGLRDALGDMQEVRRDPVITLALLLYRLRQSRSA